MPFSSVSDARKVLPSLKKKTTKQVQTFIKVFNSLEKEGTEESSAIAQAIAAANEVDKSMYLDKNTNNDKRNILSNSINSGYVLDFDDEYVYVERYTGNGYETFKHEYTFSGTDAEISEEGVEVVRLTEFKEVSESSQVDKSLVKTLESTLQKWFGGKEVPVIKQFQDEEMVAIEPLYIAAEEVDEHGATISLEDTHAMVSSLNKAVSEGNLQMGLFHKHKTDACHIEKAWVNEVDCKIGEVVVPEGQPIAKVRFTNSKAWAKRKEGGLAGLSIGAKGIIVEVGEDE